MLQIKIPEIGKFVLEDIKEPLPLFNEAIIEIKSVGICGSDISVFKGVNPVLKPPVVQGHEFEGIIDSLGSDSNSSDFKIGDKVTVFPLVNCMDCYYCNNQDELLCASQKIFDGMLIDCAMKEKMLCLCII